MTTQTLAPRFRWVLGLLPVQPHHRLLEVGCGHGIALSEVAARLGRGTILGIDRSPIMTAAAVKRNAAAIAAGRVVVRTGTLEAVDLAPGGFDLVFAINVSLFQRDARVELGRIRERLAPSGQIHLFYETPSWVHSTAFLIETRARLTAAGFTVADGPASTVGVRLVAS